MPLADYAHWNEDAEYMWWHEEGKHVDVEPEYDPDDYLPCDDEIEHSGVEDCLRDSCFSCPTATNVWECDICGERFPDGHPEQVSFDEVTT